jgi:hypothetical protein
MTIDALVSLASLRNGINDQTGPGRAAKRTMHSAGRAFLRRLSADIGDLNAEVYSNRAGPAVSGEVTLTSGPLKIWISEAPWAGRGGAHLTYTRTDWHRSTTVSMREVAEEYSSFVEQFRTLRVCPTVV